MARGYGPRRRPADVLTTPSGERLTDLETRAGPEGVLHVNGPIRDATRFTGAPVGGLVLNAALRQRSTAAERTVAPTGPLPGRPLHPFPLEVLGPPGALRALTWASVTAAG
ncbi:hypothetical protein QR97_05440 [Streptomyces sp. PBH53]|uniref:hypothetical protein n=1 Tax=Streptomyces TaxID=1883 RepID=UPI000654BFE5|nr:hypothetical protein QR97_05440 [Streptomyces sp. PBH53]